MSRPTYIYSLHQPPRLSVARSEPLYSKTFGYTSDYVGLLQHVMRMNPEKGAEFATQLANDESGPLVDVERVVDIFMSQNMIQPATSFLLDALKENKQAVVICHIFINDYKKRRAESNCGTYTHQTRPLPFTVRLLPSR